MSESWGRSRPIPSKGMRGEKEAGEGEEKSQREAENGKRVRKREEAECDRASFAELGQAHQKSGFRGRD